MSRAKQKAKEKRAAKKRAEVEARIKEAIEGRLLTFRYESRHGTPREEKHVVLSFRRYNPENDILQFRDAWTGGVRTFYLDDLAEISEKVYDVRSPKNLPH